MNKEIVPYKYSVLEYKYDEPEADLNFCSPKVVTEIRNAWNNTAYLDEFGMVWINVQRLHSILRTTKNNIRYIVEMIPEKDKVLGSDGNTYIKGSEFIKLIDEEIQTRDSRTRGHYLRLSQNFYFAIRDMDKAKLLRANYSNYLTDARKDLKKKRIKKYKIKNDELTGDKLITKTCEFSHIRSFSLFPKISDQIENGLIVNKDTHSIITEKGISTEDELFDLCVEMKWNIDWYDKYKDVFKN